LIDKSSTVYIHVVSSFTWWQSDRCQVENDGDQHHLAGLTFADLCRDFSCCKTSSRSKNPESNENRSTAVNLRSRWRLHSAYSTPASLDVAK